MITTTIVKKKSFEEIKSGKKDMQGLMARGYNLLNAARYIMLRITDLKKAKDYFNVLLKSYITTAAPKSDNIKTAVHIAFTSTGLKQLVTTEVFDTFSREFKEGMCYGYSLLGSNSRSDSEKIPERTTLLGDTHNNNPENWLWGSGKQVDCVLLLYAETNDDLDNLIATVYNNLMQGVEEVYMAKTYQYQRDISKEHFGFNDGISQPIMKGFSKSEGANEDQLINPGEFILGYKNEYNNYSPSPYVDSCENCNELDFLPGFSDKKDVGKNGTYLVFRQIEQHVEKFWDYMYQNSKEAAVTKNEKALKLAAKMIGRWPDGQPLATCPDGSYPMDGDLLTDFNYAALDKDGTRCPFGAHIRRTNPRDQVHTILNTATSIELSKKHRMLRRGRIYGEPFDEKFNSENMIDKVKKEPFTDNTKETTNGKKETIIIRGLHFICMVSDIARQFEFVQNVWANTSTFAGLCNEVDPVISPRPTKGQPDCHEFTTPQEIIRNRYKNVPEFTTVVGGAYFFMPGIKALKYIIGA